MLWVLLPRTFFGRSLYKTQLLKFGLVNLVQIIILDVILQFESFQSIFGLLHNLIIFIYSIQLHVINQSFYFFKRDKAVALLAHTMLHRSEVFTEHQPNFKSIESFVWFWAHAILHLECFYDDEHEVGY